MTAYRFDHHRVWAVGLLVAALLLLVLCTPTGSASAAGNVIRGKELAQEWCAQCHVVAANLPRPGEDRPASFQEIADTPGMGEMALNVFFQSSHRNMPNFSVADDVRDDLIAYIVSLKKP